MARIRTIKPSFFLSLTIADLDIRDRLTFIGLWTYADDHGRARDDQRLIKAAVWPLDEDMDSGMIRESLRSLAESGLICRYQHGGKPYFHITSWSEHQKVSHPTASAFPACSRDQHGGGDEPPLQGKRRPVSPPEPHPNGSGMIREASGASRARAEGKGRERKEHTSSSAPSTSEAPSLTLVSPSAQPVDDPVAKAWDTWQKATGKHRAKLDPARRRVIEKAIKSHGLNDTLAAVQGWKHDPWAERHRHLDVTVLLRDAAHIEKFRDLWRDGPPREPGTPPAINPADLAPLPWQSAQ